MNNHIPLLVVFGVLASLVFTFIAKHGAIDRIKYFAYLLGCFVLLSIVAAWLMYLFPF